jgi:hypothetical protein
MTLVQTGRIPRFPLILYGRKHWAGLVQWMKKDLVLRNKFIDAEDLELFHVTDDVEQVIKIICDYERRVGPPGTLPQAFA